MIDQKMGDYTISRSLGKGGFGSVWKAESSEGRQVALKVLHPQVLENQKVVRKFFHEAMILAKLDHPGICRLLEFFPDGDNYAIVMEYIDGTELKDILRTTGKLPFDQGFSIAKQTLDAFQYAHNNGILHRDIKPANIMITGNGDAKIMDFGIAKMSSTASHDTAASMLSIHYVPPERFDKNSEVDARSDLYSLALVFYEIFTGGKPFEATETSEIMFWHLNEIPDPPEKYCEDMPPHVSNAILKALEKNPDDRFNDFKEFSDALGHDDATPDDATVIMDTTGKAYEKAVTAAAQARQPQTETKPAGKKLFIPIVAAAVVVLVLSIGGYFVFNKSGDTAGDTATAQTAAKPPKLEEITHPVDKSKMILIPKGEFIMGSEAYSAEQPVQTIHLNKYYIDKYLVTNKQFQKFVEKTGYQTSAEKNGKGMVRIGRRWKEVEGASWKQPDGLSSIDGQDDHPVSQVSYKDAASYCKWAKKNLPTEAQWEKAARGPNGGMFPWGDSEPNDTMANFDNIVGSTTPVTKYEKGKSFFSIHDMAGNVYQWCRDWYDTGERKPKNPTGPKTGEERVIKGGSFVEGMESIRSSNRDRYEPSYSSFLFGFRCACEDL